MLSTPRLCSYAAVVVCAWAGVAAGSYDEFMSCGSAGGGGRDGFGRNFHYRPEVPCDLARNGWCETAGNQYPWQSVRRFVYENQGLMKRMYGDQRHINVLRSELMDNMFDEMAAPNVYKYQPHLSEPEPPPVSSSRRAKKIQRSGRVGARAMEVTMEPVINKNVPSSKTSQKKSSISSSKTYSRVSNKGNQQEIRQKVPARNRPPKAPPSERRRVPVKPKLKIKSKVDSTSSNKSTSPSSTTATSTSPNTPSTSPATIISTKDESTESTRTTRQMQDQITTTSDATKAESENETTIRNKQPNSETTASANQSSTTEEVSTTVQETIEPTTNDPTTTSVSGVESTVEIDSYTTVEEDTESATLLQAEFRDGAGPDIYDGAYESTYNSFDLYEKPIGGPSRHSETLTTAPGRTQETFSSYTSISSESAPLSSLTANTPSLAEITKEYESSTARSEFPLDFGDDFLSASHDDGDLEVIMFEEELAADLEEPRPLSLKERIAQDYRSSTEGSDLTTISLAERIDQAVDVRITGSSYPKDEIDLAMEETIAEDASLTPEHRREEVETEEEEEVVENEENIGNKPPEPVHMKPLKGINACPVKGEVQSPYWANNTRGEVLALLNMYPFEQYIHMEKCVHENRQMYCRNGCRCEQQYRLHRLLAFDPTNECRGIFSDWFSFPSCCVCKCYNLNNHNIFEGSSRRPRLQSNPDDEYFDDEEYYYDNEEDEEDEEFDEAENITDGDYVIEDFNLEQFEHQDTEVKSKRNQRAHTASVPPSKIQPQRAPRPLGRPKSHIAPPGPSLLPPSPNLLPPPTSSANKHQGRYEINTKGTVDTVTPTVYNNDSTWMRENGRALPLFRITRNTPENEEEQTPEKE